MKFTLLGSQKWFVIFVNNLIKLFKVSEVNVSFLYFFILLLHGNVFTWLRFSIIKWKSQFFLSIQNLFIKFKINGKSSLNSYSNLYYRIKHIYYIQLYKIIWFIVYFNSVYTHAHTQNKIITNYPVIPIFFKYVK